MRITVPMYEKGRSFLMASGLVKAYEGHQFVYLHLLCQAFENISKAMLLAEDYEKHGPLLKEHYGHNLRRLLTEVNLARPCDFLSSRAAEELDELNAFYRKHQLRYGSAIDEADKQSSLSANQFHKELVEHLEGLNVQFTRRTNDA